MADFRLSGDLNQFSIPARAFARPSLRARIMLPWKGRSSNVSRCTWLRYVPRSRDARCHHQRHHENQKDIAHCGSPT